MPAAEHLLDANGRPASEPSAARKVTAMCPIPRAGQRVASGIAALALLLLGCSNTNVEPQPSNRLPDTRITSGPPDHTSGTSYRVQLAWRGTDPDGSIGHFEYVVVDHPAAYDSTAHIVVTVPAAEDSRWRATSVVESTFVVSADTLHREPRPGTGETPADVLRAFHERWHTFFVRAVDDRGGVDPTPDYCTFNARTLAPTVSLSAPVVHGEVLEVTTTTTLGWSGEDPLDKASFAAPDSSRWVLIPSSRSTVGEFLSFPESLYTLPARFHWSPWRAWDAPDGSGVHATLRDLLPLGIPDHGFYLFAVQAKDAAGAVTPVFDSQTPGKNNVARLVVRPDLAPVVVLRETRLGTFVFANPSRPLCLTAGAGQPIRFRWRADSSEYGSEVEAFRYGWDLLDPAGDSGWECGWSPTCTEQVTARQFAAGEIHYFYLQARDTAGNATQIGLVLTALPLPLRRDLLFVDDSTYSPGKQASEAEEDRRWSAVFDSLVQRYHFQFDPVRDIYDVESNRRLLPPSTLLFDHKATVWASRRYSADDALGRLAYFFDPFVPRNRNAAPSFNYLEHLRRERRQTVGQRGRGCVHLVAPPRLPVTRRHPQLGRSDPAAPGGRFGRGDGPAVETGSRIGGRRRRLQGPATAAGSTGAPVRGIPARLPRRSGQPSLRIGLVESGGEAPSPAADRQRRHRGGTSSRRQELGHR